MDIAFDRQNRPRRMGRAPVLSGESDRQIDHTPRLTVLSFSQRAAAVRARLEATVLRRAPQVMVKVTGGGRGMGAIAAHFRYIAKAGRLPFEDDRGVVREGKEALRAVTEQWRYGGSEIGETSPRREAFNVILSMPRGTDPLIVQRAAREFAKAELRRPPLRDGAARPPGESACAPERSRRIEARQATQSAQGRSAALARDVRREAERLGNRCGSDSPGDPRRDPQLRAAMADTSPDGRSTAGALAHLEVRSSCREQPHERARGLDQDRSSPRCLEST